ncbi:MAG: phenylalanine--tRNA ligase subunit alpha, partial [Bryobacteraceae bacterium]
MPESLLSLESTLSEAQARARERIRAAARAGELEAVRVEALGRKGTLAQISRQLGQLAPEERARLGKLLNAAKETLEAALAAGKAEFDKKTLAARLDSEWLDLTLPAPGPRPGSLHPVTQVQMEIEDLFSSLG